MLNWTLHHPKMTIEHLGYIPMFIHEADTRSAAEQINERYIFGGWQSFGKGEWKLLDDNSIQYPEDPPYPPLASAKLRDETIVFYQHSWVAIIQADRSFDLARLD